MRLYSPVDLTGKVNMIEKLVLGGTGTWDLPILSPTCHQVTNTISLLNKCVLFIKTSSLPTVVLNRRRGLERPHSSSMEPRNLSDYQTSSIYSAELLALHLALELVVKDLSKNNL